MNFLTQIQIKIIKQFFSKHSMIHERYIKSFMYQHIDIFNKLQKQLQIHPQWKSINNIIFGILHDKKLIKCMICGKYIKFNRYSKIQASYCSNKCRNSDRNIIQKMNISRMNTCIQKYGVINIFQTEECKQKIRQTNIQKYGVENVYQSNQIKQKIKKTNLQRYGVQNYTKTQQCLQKIKQTNLNRYGVQYAIQNQKIKNNIKQKNLAKYGVTCTLNNPAINEKAKQTFIKKYGVDNPLKSEIIKIKILNTNTNKNWLLLLDKIKDIVIPNFNKSQFCGRQYYKKYSWKCVKCNNIFEDHIYSHIPRCPNCYPVLSGISKNEKQILNFCKLYFHKILENDRKIIKPYQLDIVIPQIKLAIQFNGLWYHSLENGTYLNYHLNKTQMCQQKGYRLIHIWQDQWKNNKEQIKQKLISIFTNNEIIDYSKPLDRCWYSTIQFQNYQIIQPEIIIKNNYHIENCGYLKVIK